MDERAAALLQLLFRSPGDLPVFWQFLDALSREMSHDVRAVTLVETLAPTPMTVMFGSGVQRAFPGLLPRPCRRERESGVPLGVVFDVPPWREGVSALRRELFDPEGILPGPGLGVGILNEERRLMGMLAVLPRTESWMPSAEDRALLTHLAPFLVQAMHLHRRLVGARAVTAVLDHLVLGVILLDDQGHLTYANRSAAELIGIEPGLGEPRLDGARDARTEALYRTVPRENGAAPSVYRHPADGRPLQVLVTELSWPNPLGGEARRFSRAVFIGDPKLRSGDPIQRLGLAYGFTQGEAKLAWLLVGDLSLSEAATRLGITESTARTVLKRILAKTGTRRQASLVRLLLSGPAQLRRDAPVSSPPNWG